MESSAALWGPSVVAQLETLRADLKILNDIKQTAVAARAIPLEPLSSSQARLVEKLDRMIETRLDVMISLETSDDDEEEDDPQPNQEVQNGQDGETSALQGQEDG